MGWTVTGPPMVPGAYNNNLALYQTADHVVIINEMVHEQRIIPLDGRPHLGQNIRQLIGDSRGHWEDNTLVVDTTNFRDRSAYRNANPDTLRLIERFTRTAPDRVEWSVTVEDPSTWTRSWTFAVPLTVNNSEPVYEYACHEGNYGLQNMLTSARFAEKAAEDAKKK